MSEFSSAPTLTGERSAVTRALAERRVGSTTMISFVGAAAAPLMVVAALTSTAWAVTGFVGIPVVFLLIGAVLMLFAVGYTAMSRHVTNAGALYSYVTHGIGRPVGVGAAFIALIAYNGLQVGLYGAFGVITSELIAARLGITVSWWILALAAWAGVAALGVLRIDINGRVLTLLLAAECAIILVADVVMIANPAAGSVSFETLAPSNLATLAIGAPIVVTATAFVGFEAPTVYAEEARDPRRTVPLATFTALIVIAALYALSSWALTVNFGPDGIVAASQEQGPELLFNAVAAHLGGPAGDIARILLLTSIFAGLLSFHNTVARYSFALGREQVLPSALGLTSRRSGSPKAGSLVQSSIGLFVLVLFAATGLDPMVHLFFTLGTGGGLGVLTLLAATSISVIVFFVRRRTAGASTLTMVAAVLSSLLLCTGVGLALSNMDVLLGVPPGTPVTWIIPTLYFVALTVGVLWGLHLRRRRPDAYTLIGRGALAELGPIRD